MDFNTKYWPLQIVYAIVFIFFMFYNQMICILMIGVILLSFAIYGIWFVNNIKKNGIERTGKIVSYESNRKGYKTPVIEFQIGEGDFFTGKPSIHSSSDLDKFRTYTENINKTVKIIYSPKSPENFILKDSSNDFAIILFIVIGLVLTCFSVGNLLGYNYIF